MNIEVIIFEFFKWFILFSSVMVIIATNPIHSILFLIMVFCGVSGLLLLIQVEFIAMVLIVVYVGAIAILFLFVVMMLNIRLQQPTEDFLVYLPITVLFSILFITQFSVLIYGNLSFKKIDGSKNKAWIDIVQAQFDIYSLSELIYTHFFLYFEIAGIILLVAMIGSIHLTLSKRFDVKKQYIYKQLARNSLKQIDNFANKLSNSFIT